MTLEEHAEKIITALALNLGPMFGSALLGDKEIRGQIAAEIRAAVEEGRIDGVRIHHEQHAKIRAEAYEDAARIADGAIILPEAGLGGQYDRGYNDACVAIYYEIRARLKEISNHVES